MANEVSTEGAVGIQFAARPIRKRYCERRKNTSRFINEEFGSDDIREVHAGVRRRRRVPLRRKEVRCNPAEKDTDEKKDLFDTRIILKPMRDQKETASSLQHLAEDVGIHAELVSDSAPLFIGPQSKFVKQANFLLTKLRSSEPHTQRQNEDEGTTRILKRRWKKRMSMKNIPKRLWDFCLVYEAQILSMIGTRQRWYTWIGETHGRHLRYNGMAGFWIL